MKIFGKTGGWLAVTLLCLISPLGMSISPARAGETTKLDSSDASGAQRPFLQASSVLDADFDGIPTGIEQSGWYNKAGGPFVTNPFIADTDGDGLSDGQEQLFDTIPTNVRHPGIYVEYRPELNTRKYYAWQQHGSKFIVHGYMSPSKYQDVIVRRGSTFYVGGPPNATLEIVKSDPLLDDLEVVNNSCSQLHAIHIPADARLGRYTIRLKEGGWSRSLWLYVILQLDGPGQSFINSVNAHYAQYGDTDTSTAQDYLDVLAYDDDRNNLKDTLTLYFDTSYEYTTDPAFDPANHDIYGWGIGWETDYNQQYVFEDYVMPAVSTLRTRLEVANALRDKVNSEDPGNISDVLNFNATVWPNSTWNALYGTSFQDQDGNQQGDCNSHAALLTTFLRTAGFTARPVGADYTADHYDHSTEVWLDNQWKVTRAYTHEAYQTRTWWGTNRYKPTNNGIPVNDMLMVAGPNWEWDQQNTKYRITPPSDSEYGIDYRTGRYEDPLQVPYGPGSQIERWSWVKTPTFYYWGIQPPQVIADCGNCGNQVPTANPLTIFQTSTSTTAPQAQSPIAHFAQIVADYGVDTDGDGRYNQLMIEVEVEVNQPGYYTIEGILNDLDPTTRLALEVDAVDWVQQAVYLEAGTRIVPLAFQGLNINAKGVPGPYVVERLRLTNIQNPSPEEFFDNLIDQHQPNYLTAAYAAEDFENLGAKLNGNYSHQTGDANGDGYVDSLTVATNLDMSVPGPYRVEAELVDSDGNLVATSEWTGTDGQIRLPFEALLGDVRPYHVTHVLVYNAAGRIVDSASDSPGVYSTGPLYNLGLSAAAVTSPTLTGETAVDTDGDGDFDRLDFNVEVSVPVAGNYRLEGWLENSAGSLIAWQTSNPTFLSVGGPHSLTLSFPGQAINAFMTNGPYKLTALKVLGNGYTVIDEINEADQTAAYAFDEFDSSDIGSLGEDLNNWNLGQTAWDLTQEAAFSPIASWTDSPGGNYGSGQARLTSKPLSVPDGAISSISFQSCYQITQDGDQGRVEYRLNGTNWSPIAGAAYSGQSSWVHAGLQLPITFGLNENLEFRFVLDANSSGHNDGWYVDDVSITFNLDADNDNVDNRTEADPNGDGIPEYPDSDDDDTPDYLDNDDDGDGVPTADEDWNRDGDPTNDDHNDNGIPDYLDPEVTSGGADVFLPIIRK